MKYSIYSLLALCVILASGCAKEQRLEDDKECSVEEIEKRYEDYLKKNKKHYAANALENLIALYPEHKDIGSYRLKLADLHFDLKNYEKADKNYRKYLKMNPSQGDYASYRSILSQFNQTLSIDRDPAPLTKTIKRCKKHLNNAMYNKGNYVSDVRNILYTSERKLIDREIYTFNFYLERNQYKSAEHRLKELEARLSSHPEQKPRLQYLNVLLSINKDEIEKAQETTSQLMKEYPNSLYADMASRLIHPEKAKTTPEAYL